MNTSSRSHGLKGLVITPPVIGRISIGRVVERNGKRLPEKDDQFTLTTQIQDGDGWRLHPLDEALRQGSQGKLRSIPVRLLFNDPDLNLRTEFTLFDRKTGRPRCKGNGEECQRATAEGVQALPCPSPSLCALAEEGGCKPYGRLNVLVGDDDDMGTFIFRTTGINSIRTLTARLHYFAAVSGGLLSCLPLELRLRGKSTAQSFGRPIYYVDLVVRSGMTLVEAITKARQLDAERKDVGLDQTALDEAGRQGYQRGVFEDGDEDAEAVVEEFFPVASDAAGSAPSGLRRASREEPTKVAILREKLSRRTEAVEGSAP